VFEISLATISTQICFFLVIGLVASLFPAWKASNGKIVTALRAA
jgi:ABC-type lipoprotein release transport system permease subunit